MSDRMRICPGCNATFGATEGHACATTIYAGQGSGNLAMALLAGKAKECPVCRGEPGYPCPRCGFTFTGKAKEGV